MASIFLSYAREDRAFAEKLARVQESAGHNVWWDRHIESGREFACEIEAELARADVVVVAWSQAAAKSPWVRDEAAIGRDRGRLLPVLVDGSEPPIGFRQLQALDLTGWKGRRNDRRTKALVDAVESVLGGSAPELPGSKRLPPWRRRTPRVIAVALALIFAVAAGIYVFNASSAEAEPASLAVLPFKNMAAGDPYFAEGVAEEIASQLGREPQFKVTGRTSSALFKDAADLRDVGRRLHVAYVLEGSVRSSGNQVRVAVSLVNARSGARMWSQDFRGSLNDIFAIQDRIGQQVAANVKRQLVADPVSGTLVTSGEVHSLYLRARSLMHQREPEKIRESIRLLRRAVQIDPDYAPAWARLALALTLWETYGTGGGSTPEQRISYAERAIALAPKLGDAHAVLGLNLYDDENLDAATIRRGRKELEWAVRLNPGDSESWYWLHAVRFNDLDFQGALDAFRRSIQIDPFFVLNSNFPLLASDMGFREEAAHFYGDWITNHPDAFIRELARGGLAGLNNDFSGKYIHAKRAREIATSPDVRSVAEGVMGSTLLQLHLLDEAERFVPPPIVGLRRGKLTFAQTLRQRFPRALDFWILQQEARLFPKAMVKFGRSSDLVRLYDEAFASTDDMALRMPKPSLVNLAPLVAISLQKAGRGKEGAQILLLGNRICDRGARGPHAPVSFHVHCSRLWSVLGQKERAIRTLERALREGWRPSEADYPKVTDEPAYAMLRNDSRMQRIDATIAAEFARERRELLAAGV